MLQNATPLRKSAPWPPNISDEYVSCTAPATENECIFADPLQISHACHRFWTCYKTLTFCSLLTGRTTPCAWHAKRHLNAQKCSEAVSLLHFWLRNVLRTTTACTFWTSQLLKVLRSWGVLYILTWKCASCHNGVQFFISHLASWLCACRFSEPTFRPSGATNHWKKHSVSQLSHPFGHLDLLSSETLSLFDLLSPSLLFSDSSHLCFSSVFIVGSLTSKLPSIIHYLPNIFSASQPSSFSCPLCLHAV